MEFLQQRTARECWFAGWSPSRLLREVRRHGSSVAVNAVVVRVLLADDAARSRQARDTLWCHEMTILRATTGVSDVGPGWLGRWLDRQPDVGRSVALVVEVAELLASRGWAEAA